MMETEKKININTRDVQQLPAWRLGLATGQKGWEKSIIFLIDNYR